MSDNNKYVHKSSVLDVLFQGGNYLFNFLFALLCFYPFYYLFLVTISDSNAVYRGEVVFLPVKINFLYYKQVFEYKGLLMSLFVSLGRTVAGTIITLFFTSMLAYVFTKKEFKWRKTFYRLTIFTMYASAGLIPWVVTYTLLGLRNSFLVYILPSAVSAFGLVLVKTYIEQMAPAVEESAIIDGAGYFTIFIKIIIPLTKPVIAALGVFSAVGQWNSFQDNFFLVQNHNLQTMQLTLYNILQNAERLAEEARRGNTSIFATLKIAPPDPFSIKCTVAVVTMLPVLLVYPFLQKFFVSGIMLGAVKG